jgi:hypothetical protein
LILSGWFILVGLKMAIMAVMTAYDSCKIF